VAAGRISIDSPVGTALLGKMVDDEITIRRPAGDLQATIIGISATRPDAPE